MAYTQYEWQFNNSNEIDIIYAGNYGAKGEKRSKKKKATPEQIKKQNQRNRENKMRRLIKANFEAGDLWCTLKYPAGTRKSVDEVQDDLRKFLVKLRRRYKKIEFQLKFVYRIELGSQGGIHTHILVNRVPDADVIIQKLWTHGRVNWTSTYDAGGFQSLAEYIVKEPEEIEGQLSMFDTADRGKLIKYGCSRNLVRPEPVKKTYSRRTVRKIVENGPKPKPGYYIDKNTIRIGINPYTGYSYIHYIEYKLKKLLRKGEEDAGQGLYRKHAARTAKAHRHI